MEFGNVGQHCGYKFCHQQDFLPFECEGCKGIYCTEHARADDHECRLPMDYDSIIVIICPVCEARIKLKKADDPNQAWNQHAILPGACVPKVVQGQKQAKKCMAEKCYVKLNDINSSTCSRCKKEVCIKHRYYDDHQCTHIIPPTVVRNDKTAKSKLLQPGYFQNNQQQQESVAAASSMSQTDYSNMESQIKNFSAASTSQAESKPYYQPERCEACGSLFLDQEEFLRHVDSHFKQVDKMMQPKTETQKCPHCPKRFAITELPNHMQQDHFIF